MAEILRGKHKGKTGSLHQFANDWVMVDLSRSGGPANTILSPSSIKAGPQETKLFEASMQDPNQNGFWREWVIVTDEDGTSTFRRPAGWRRRRDGT